MITIVIGIILMAIAITLFVYSGNDATSDGGGLFFFGVIFLFISIICIVQSTKDIVQEDILRKLALDKKVEVKITPDNDLYYELQDSTLKNTYKYLEEL